MRHKVYNGSAPFPATFFSPTLAALATRPAPPSVHSIALNVLNILWFKESQMRLPKAAHPEADRTRCRRSLKELNLMNRSKRVRLLMSGGIYIRSPAFVLELGKISLGWAHSHSHAISIPAYIFHFFIKNSVKNYRPHASRALHTAQHKNVNVAEHQQRQREKVFFLALFFPSSSKTREALK